MNKASKRTINNLYGVSPKLVSLVGYALAISEQDFFVAEGMRSLERQKELYKQGFSKLDGVTKKSNHQVGRAVDVYYSGWKNTDKADDSRWTSVYTAFRTAAANLGVKIVVAGQDWTRFKDKPHIELASDEPF